MEQPFVFGVPADDPYFIGREGSPKNVVGLLLSLKGEF